MKHRLLTTPALIALLLAGWTVLALAGECKGATARAATRAKSPGCTAEMAAKCTAAQAAACKAKGASAVTAGSPSCSGHGTAAHMNCDGCADMAKCDAEVKAAGGQTQVVKLKNGVMFVYTAAGPAQVRAVQAALARRSDRLAAMAAAGDKAKLCPGCRDMRGAMASGKLTREIVTIEGGCLSLMTSNDPAIVAKLHAMAGTEMAARSKS
jgi:hypothetical protein